MLIRFVPDTEVVQHQLAQQELEGQAALSYEEYLRRLTQAVDTEVGGVTWRRCSTSRRCNALESSRSMKRRIRM